MSYLDALLEERKAELGRAQDEKRKLAAQHQRKLAEVQARIDELQTLVNELVAFIAFRDRKP